MTYHEQIQPQANMISLSQVRKVFHRDTQHEQSALVFLKRLFFLRKDMVKNEKVVLENVNINIKRGERVGVIGRNGTGKSTLLRIVASIYEQDGGDVRVGGSVAYISGFNQGVRARLSAEDNIRILGALYGVPTKVVDAMYGSIISFAELDESKDDKVFTYSDGMRSRLAFSACMHFIEFNNPDIILLDEVFSGGGDTLFQEKAKKRLNDFLKKDKTVMFVTHAVEQLKQFCQRTILIKDNTIYADGDTGSIVEKYKNIT